LVVDNAGHGLYFVGMSGAGLAKVIETGTREPESAVQIGFAAGLSFAAVASVLF